MMKLILIAPALLVVAGCGRAAPDPRGVDRGETLLTVTGTGRAEAAPDQALFTAGLSSIAPSAEAASARNAEIMNRSRPRSAVSTCQRATFRPATCRSIG